MSNSDDEIASPDGVYDFTKPWLVFRQNNWQELIQELAGKPIHCLEFGAHEGRSAVWILENFCTHPDSKLTSIDSFEEKLPYTKSESEVKLREARFRYNIAATGKEDQVEVIKGKAFDTLIAWNHSRNNSNSSPRFDFIFNSEYRESESFLTDTLLVWPLLKDNGVIIFEHYIVQTYLERWNNPFAGVQSFLNAYIRELVILHFGYELTVRKVTNEAVVTNRDWSRCPSPSAQDCSFSDIN